MRVILNGLAALKPRTGVGHYVAHLHAALTSEFPADAVTLYPGPAIAAAVRRLQRGNAGGGGGPRGARLKPALKAAARRLAGLHFRLAARTADVVHEPNFVPFSTGRPTVVTVHDLSVVNHPEWHPADRVGHHAAHFRAALAAASQVIVVSDAVRAELVAYAGLDPGRVTTVYNGTDPAMAPLPRPAVDAVLARLGLPPRFLLALGTVEPRKNLLTALRAFAALPADVRRGCPLVMAGPWGWRADAEREFIATTAAPAGARHLGYVPAADLPAVVNAAAALVYPSFYEGFGLPPVETLAVGGRVLASASAAAVREVCGRFAEYLDPADVTAWTTAMRAAAEGGPPADAADRVRHAAQYSWPRAARETMAVYRRAAGC